MPRISHCLALAVGAALLVAQLAQAQAAHSHDHRHHHREALAHRRPVAAILQDVASLPFYGPFGGHSEAAAAADYAGPNQRHYFGYGSGRHFGASW